MSSYQGGQNGIFIFGRWERAEAASLGIWDSHSRSKSGGEKENGGIRDESGIKVGRELDSSGQERWLWVALTVKGSFVSRYCCRVK